MRELAIVGAGGVLGTKLVEQALAKTDARIHAFTHGGTDHQPSARDGFGRVRWKDLDIGDPVAVSNALAAAHPQVVINAAAMTNVDACEARRDDAWAANALGPRHLAAACVELEAALLHVSTDYVFPGDEQQPGPYLEDAPVRPINHYGWTKLMGDRAVEEVCGDRTPWVVARTALVYGHVPGGRPNFVSWLVNELRAGRRVRIVDDQFNTPTLADDLAAALLQLADRGGRGTFHLAGPDLISRADWARAIARRYRLDLSLVDLTTSDELRQLARRPLLSGLRTRRLEDMAGIELRGVEAGFGALGLE